VNSPDISTPETENPPEQRAESRTEWRLGPLGIAAMVVLVLVDIFIPATFRSGQSSEGLLLGLSFGQMGAVILLAASAKKLTWQWLLACYAASLVMCIHFAAIEGARDLRALPMLLAIWGGYTTITLGFLFGLRWIRQQQSREGLDWQREERIQFNVRHLLILMTVFAMASLLLRFAIPMFLSANIDNILGWVVLSVAFTLAAIELRRNTRNLFWQLGGLAAIGIVCSLFVTWMVEFDGILFAAAVQLAILMMVMVVLEFERYTITVNFEPRTEP
jgi:hypothetical protein